MFEVYNRLSKLPYFQHTELPKLTTEYVSFDLSQPSNAEEVFNRFGISSTSTDPGNSLFVHRHAGRPPYETAFRFRGADNIIILDQNCGFHGSLIFEGKENLVVVFGEQGRAAIAATLYTRDTLVWGRRSFAWGVSIWIQGGTVCTIGDDCLFSMDIIISTSDHHSIIDLDSLEQINPPADVTIGQHVWIGNDCAILKGAQIGDGAIIGRRSLVTSVVPKAELWAGSPARMLRRRVSWVPSYPVPSPEEMAALGALLGPVSKK
jgi:acetyltransferase-like isoleucine patch superfamily enzyme